MDVSQWQSLRTEPTHTASNRSKRESMQRELAQCLAGGDTAIQGGCRPRAVDSHANCPPRRAALPVVRNRSRSGIRTRYFEIQNLALYQMSYSTIPCLCRWNPVRGTCLRDRRTAASTPPDGIRRNGRCLSRRWLSTLCSSLGAPWSDGPNVGMGAGEGMRRGSSLATPPGKQTSLAPEAPGEACGGGKGPVSPKASPREPRPE